MKKSIIIPLLIIVMLAFCSLAVSAQLVPVAYLGYPIVKLFVNDVELVASDMYAVIMQGRTMVPLRLVAEALGAEVEYDQEQNRVLITTRQEETETYIAPPKKELITVSDLSYQGYYDNYSQVFGKVKNDNTDYIDAEIAIYFYDDRGILDHVHVSVDGLGPGETTNFVADAQKDLARNTRKEIIIYQLNWDD